MLFSEQGEYDRSSCLVHAHTCITPLIGRLIAILALPKLLFGLVRMPPALLQPLVPQPVVAHAPVTLPCAESDEYSPPRVCEKESIDDALPACPVCGAAAPCASVTTGIDGGDEE